MIILDTNVISEAMRGPSADPRVLRWLADVTEMPVTTVVNRAEVLAGLALLPDGKRKVRLRAAAEIAFDGLGVCLPLTIDATSAYADIIAARTAAGRPIGTMDALTAAIARVTDSTLATHVTGFDGLGLALIDPWHP